MPGSRTQGRLTPHRHQRDYLAGVLDPGEIDSPQTPGRLPCRGLRPGEDWLPTDTSEITLPGSQTRGRLTPHRPQRVMFSQIMGNIFLNWNSKSSLDCPLKYCNTLVSLSDLQFDNCWHSYLFNKETVNFYDGIAAKTSFKGKPYNLAEACPIDHFTRGNYIESWTLLRSYLLFE